MLRLSLRHLRRHWQLNLIMFLAVLAGASLAAAMPMYTRAVADSAVEQAISNTTIPQQNLTLSGNVLNATVADLDEALGDLTLERQEFALARTSVVQKLIRPDGTVDDTFFSAFFADLWSINPIEEEIVVVDGRMPSGSLVIDSSGTIPKTIIEIALGSNVATSGDIQLAIGDRIRLERYDIELEIVGFVAPIDREADIWFGDSTLLRFEAQRFVDASINIDEMRLGILMQMDLLNNFITNNTEWRYLIDHDQIDAGNMGQVRTLLLSTQSELESATHRVQTGLIDTLGTVIREQAQAQSALYFLLIQSLLAILYTLFLLTQLSIEQAQQTLGTLVGRGFTRLQLTYLLGLGSGLLFVGLAFPIAPFIALLFIRFWTQSDPLLEVQTLPLESWQLAAGIALICWLMVVIATYVSTGRNLLDWMQQRGRPGDSEGRRRRLVIELFILAAGGLTYWQVQSSDRLFDLAGSDSRFGGGDPILLLAPTLVLLGIGLLSLRLLPYLIQFIARLSKRSPTFLAPISLLRLARDTALPTRIVLLITFTVALALFANIMGGSIIQRQSELAHYATGADLRVRLPIDQELAQIEISQLEANPSIRGTSEVVRGRAFLSNEASATYFNTFFIAVNPSTLPNVSFYPPNLSPFTLETVVSILQPTEPGILPIVLGSNRQTLEISRGDRFDLTIGRSQIPVEVVGIIETFPTASQTFFITNRSVLETLTDFEDPTLEVPHTRELWIDAAAGQRSAVISAIEQLPTDQYAIRLLGNSVAQTETYQKGLIARQTSAALRINTIILLILSVVGFLSVQYFSTKQRSAEFGVMQALGVGRRAWFRIVSTETIVLLILGLLLGSILGVALSYLMRPLLVSLITTSTGSAVPIDLTFSIPSIGGLLGVMLLIYAAAITVLNLLLHRSDLQSQLRLTQE